MAVNFELVTELQTLHRRDMPLADETILQPSNVRPLVEGEWLAMDSDGKLAREGDNDDTTADPSTNALLYVVHTEKGRYDTQSIKKANVLMLGMYEAETAIADLTGADIGDALTVNDVDVGGIVRRGLLAESPAAGSGKVVVGYVTKVIGTTKIRFVHFANHKVF